MTTGPQTTGRLPSTGMLFGFARGRFDATTGLLLSFWGFTRTATAVSFHPLQVCGRSFYARSLSVRDSLVDCNAACLLERFLLSLYT